MRELSAKEKAFLRAALPEPAGGELAEHGVEGKSQRVRRPKVPSSRLMSTLASMLSYLPLTIGIATLAVSGVALYLYIWARDLFKVSELERMNTDGTLNFVEQTTGQSLEEILMVFNAAPWIILGTVVLGILLMGSSMLIIGKRRNG